MQKLINDNWVDCSESELVNNDIYRVAVGGKLVNGKLVNNGWEQKQHYTPEPAIEPVEITVELSAYQCKLGATIDYTITFSQSITVDGVVPISISDRNGNHVMNIGCIVNKGKSSGSFTMSNTGDFTVTNKAINFHKKSIMSELVLTEQPWLRVYQ